MILKCDSQARGVYIFIKFARQIIKFARQLLQIRISVIIKTERQTV